MSGHQSVNTERTFGTDAERVAYDLGYRDAADTYVLRSKTDRAALIRRWAIEKAVESFRGNGHEEILKAATAFASYVNGERQPAS